MGACLNSDSKSKEVDKDLKKDKAEDQTIKKLLFLGAGGSGKSTLFKQLRTLHGEGYTNNDRLGFAEHIESQCIEQMKLVLERIENGGDDQKADGNLYGVLSDNAQKAAVVLKKVKKLSLTDEVTESLKVLWNEDKIKLIYNNREIPGLDDSTSYFWDKIEEISDSKYVPDQTDVLFVRYRTTGVIKQRFVLKDTNFQIFDVGGQKSERRKWINCFEFVTAVIFVVSLSCYDEKMFEDIDVNAMDDSLTLFEEICNNKYFMTSSVILFLNKKDLFAEKISSNKPITLCPSYKDYDGVNDSYDETTTFIKKKFLDQRENKSKKIYTHLTCATDQSNVEKVFNDVQSIIIENSLMGAGLLPGIGGMANEPEKDAKLL